MIREKIVAIVAENVELPVSEVEKLLEKPVHAEHGDFAFPCFGLAKVWKKSPPQIAQDLVGKFVDGDPLIERVEVVGGYLNFFVDSGQVAKLVLPAVARGNRGKWEPTGRKILVESPSPNTNKPLHLGHVRNLLLGNALENVLNFAGERAVRVEVVNDRGIHICKSMLAYKLRWENAEPDEKSDHFVGKFYVKFAQEAEKNPELENQAQEMLRAREAGDDDVRALRAKMNAWAIAGFEESYETFGTRIEDRDLESEIYARGKEIVLAGLEKWVFVRDLKWNIAFPIEKPDGETSFFVVLRADGTSIYATQDIALAATRREKRAMDRVIHVVGNEQAEYFKILFVVLAALGYEFAARCFHLSYGMIALPEGKMKSRTGRVVDADELVENVEAMAVDTIRERNSDLDDAEILRRAKIVAMAAIKFFFLKYDFAKDFVFDPKGSLSFEGETGPYLLYSFARAAGLLRKSGEKLEGEIDFSLLKSVDEKKLLLLIDEFPQVVAGVAKNYKIQNVPKFVLDLAGAFHGFYQRQQILVEDEATRKARLALVKNFMDVLESGLGLLGIEVLEEM